MSDPQPHLESFLVQPRVLVEEVFESDNPADWSHWLQCTCANDVWLHLTDHHTARAVGQASDLFSYAPTARPVYRPLRVAAAWAADHPGHPALTALHRQLPDLQYLGAGPDVLGTAGGGFTLPGLFGEMEVLRENGHEPVHAETGPVSGLLGLALLPQPDPLTRPTFRVLLWRTDPADFAAYLDDHV
jgi:hypothetical protein